MFDFRRSIEQLEVIYHVGTHLLSTTFFRNLPYELSDH